MVPWLGALPLAFKPIVRVGTVTYRVTRIDYDEYELVRIIDDRRLGTFRSFPDFEVTSSEIDPAFVRQVAQLAAKRARPSWIERIGLAWRRRGCPLPKPDGS